MPIYAWILIAGLIAILIMAATIAAL